MGNSTKLKFVNKNSSALSVRLEPWLDEFEIEENDAVLFTGQNCDQGEIEIECSANEVVIYGTVGSICELSRIKN